MSTGRRSALDMRSSQRQHLVDRPREPIGLRERRHRLLLHGFVRDTRQLLEAEAQCRQWCPQLVRGVRRHLALGAHEVVDA